MRRDVDGAISIMDGRQLSLMTPAGCVEIDRVPRVRRVHLDFGVPCGAACPALAWRMCRRPVPGPTMNNKRNQSMPNCAGGSDERLGRSRRYSRELLLPGQEPVDGDHDIERMTGERRAF